MVCPPLRCDKGETCSRAARLPDYPRILSPVNGVRPLHGTSRARLPALGGRCSRPLDMADAQAIYDESDDVVRDVWRLTFRREEPTLVRGQISIKRS